MAEEQGDGSESQTLAPKANRLSESLYFHERGEFARAEALYTEILASEPNNASALRSLGALMIQTGRPEGAAELITRALAAKPDDAEALSNRGVALQNLQRLDEALASHDRAVALLPGSAKVLYNRGNVLKQLKRFDEALASYDMALALEPDHVKALNNRGNTLKELERFGEALASYDKAIALKPGFAEVHFNRGIILMEWKRFEEALASFDRALALEPDYGDAAANRAHLALLTGDFAAGWLGYEHRWRQKKAAKRRLSAPFPVWAGESLLGKKIIVYDEQALGDIIQFSRYLKLLVASGAEVTFLVLKNLKELMRSLDSSVRLLTTFPAGENFDFQSALASLPLAFRTRLASVPGETPYLHAEPDRVRKWKDRLGGPGFKIGIAWQGSKALPLDLGRSFPLAELFGVSRVPDVRLISLQKNDGVEQLREMPGAMKVETLGEDMDAGEDAFLDTAAIMEHLDLVISSDTSMAHLAGALGRPVWVALKHVPDWRWLMDRPDSPWYPTMRLFRQSRREDWRSVFSEMEAALLPLVRGHRPAQSLGRTAPHAPISWGELIDKITILEIKSVEAISEAAQSNVRQELRLLQELADRNGVSGQIAALKSNLKAINVGLRATENAIRQKEDRKEFDDEFIELARSIYRQNDQRAVLKRQINDILASEIIKES